MVPERLQAGETRQKTRCGNHRQLESPRSIFSDDLVVSLCSSLPGSPNPLTQRAEDARQGGEATQATWSRSHASPERWFFSLETCWYCNESRKACVEIHDLALVSTIVRPVSDSVRPAGGLVSVNLRPKPPLIARRAVHDCAPVHLRTIQLLLGHRNLSTTARYLMIATDKVCATVSPLESLHDITPAVPDLVPT